MSSNKTSSKAAKPTMRKAPEGMVMLRPDGANMTDWLNENGIRLESEFGDIAKFIRGKEYPIREMLTSERIAEDYPQLNANQRSSLLVKAAENNLKDIRADKVNKHLIYARLEACVSVDGFDRVTRMDGFEETTNGPGGKDPKALLELIIAEHTLKTDNVSDIEARYIARTRYDNVRMTPEQTLTDFTRAFERIITNMQTLNVDPLPTEENQVYHFFMRLDSRRYGSYQTTVVNALRKGEDNAMPATIQKVVDAARKHVPTAGTGPSGGMASNKSNPMVFATNHRKPARDEDPTCERCGGRNHSAADCMTGAEKVKAYKQKLKEGEKATATVMTTISHHSDTPDATYDGSDTAEELFNYSLSVRAMKTQTESEQHQELNDRKVFIDSLANRNFMSNKDLLTNIRQLDTDVKGIHGTGTLTEAGEVPVFGEALYAPEAGVNGLAMCMLERKFNVEYEQGVAFKVDVGDNLSLTFAYDDALESYACLFTDDVMLKLKELQARNKYSTSMAMITTTEQNKSKYTTREVKGANYAREMMRRMYYPSDSALVRTLTKGAMLECPVTGKDVVTATEIYGMDVSSLKGKTKDKGPIGDYRTLVPKMMRKEQIIYGDIFHWRDVSFILYFAKPLNLLLVQWIPKSNLEHMIKATTSVCNRMTARGFTCTEIIVDPAKELVNLDGKLPVHINTVGSRTHVAEAEVQIRTVKERLRASASGLPYNVPKSLIRYQVYGIVYCLNLTLKKDETVSARELFTGVKPVYKRDIRAEFGEYVQAHVPPGEMLSRTGKERTVGALALCSADNDRGTWWFLNIKRGSTFKADRWTALPTPDIVIEKINQMYDNEEGKARDKKLSKGATRSNNNMEPADLTREVIMNETEGMLRLPEERDVIPDAVESATDGLDHTYTDPDTVDHTDDLCREDGVDRNTEAALTHTNDIPNPNHASTDKNGVEEEESLTHDDKSSGINTTNVEATNSTTELGTEMIAGSRRSLRNKGRRKQWQKNGSHAYRLTVKKALQENKMRATESIKRELSQMVQKKVWKPVNKRQLTAEQIKKTIRSSMFLKEKFSASGEFEKLKARLVAGGDMQDKGLYEDLSSPTVSQETVMTALAIAAIEKRRVATVDITGAYLECRLPAEDEVHMRLDPLLSGMFVTARGYSRCYHPLAVCTSYSCSVYSITNQNIF